MGMFAHDGSIAVVQPFLHCLDGTTYDVTIIIWKSLVF